MCVRACVRTYTRTYGCVSVYARVRVFAGVRACASRASVCVWARMRLQVRIMCWWCVCSCVSVYHFAILGIGHTNSDGECELDRQHGNI